MHIIWSIIIGFIVGLIARFLMPGKDPAGFIITTVLGIVGTLIVAYAGQALGWYRGGESAGFIISIIGAMILLFLYRLFVGGRRREARPAGEHVRIRAGYPPVSGVSGTIFKFR